MSPTSVGSCSGGGVEKRKKGEEEMKVSPDKKVKGTEGLLGEEGKLGCWH